MFTPEYIERLQDDIESLYSVKVQRNLSLIFNVALIICVLILGGQIEKLAGF